VEYWDESANCTYYFNTKTQEASWTRPGSVGGNVNPSANVEAGDNSSYEFQNFGSGVVGMSTSPWVESFDSSSNTKYWYNTETGEASWTDPHGKQNSPDWVSYIDEKTGNEYWYNTTTGETSWEP